MEGEEQREAMEIILRKREMIEKRGRAQSLLPEREGAKRDRETERERRAGGRK